MIDILSFNAAPYPEDNDALEIRRATMADLPLVAKLDATDNLMARQPVGAEKRLAGKIMSGDIFLALDGGVVLGYARYDMLWPEMAPLLAWMWVEPEHRRTGLATELRRFTFSELKKEGVNSVLRSACTERPEMIERIRRECGPEAGRLRYENGVEEVFFWQSLEKF